MSGENITKKDIEFLKTVLERYIGTSLQMQGSVYGLPDTEILLEVSNEQIKSAKKWLNILYMAGDKVAVQDLIDSLEKK